MKCVEARVPLHLSIVWVPVVRGDPLHDGSLGAGLMLEPPVRALACNAPGGYHGPKIPPALRCLRSLGWNNEFIRVETPYPPGYGLAVSGAVTLAACLAYAGLRAISSIRAADEAHVAEVLEGTGLGDVTALYTAWGLEVRVEPGAPGVGGRAEAHPVEELWAVAVPVRSVDTRVLLREMWSRVTQDDAIHAYEAVRREPSLESLARAAREFTMRATPPPEAARRAIAECSSRAHLVVYKKGSLVIIVDEPHNTIECLEKIGLRAILLRLTNTRPFTRWIDLRENVKQCSHTTC